MKETTIKIKKEIKERLDGLKIIPEDSYNNTINRLLDKLNELQSEILLKIDNIERRV
jgi:hypothetical protein